MRAATLEIIAPMPTFYAQCKNCDFMFRQADTGLNKEVLSEYPVEFKREYFRLHDLVNELKTSFGERLLIKVVDSMSLEGIIKCIKHRCFKSPAFILNGKEKRMGLLSSEELKNFVGKNLI